MATAHWHFAMAEQLLAKSDRQLFVDAIHAVRLAQVHATLAHAAALGANEEPLPSLDDYCLCPTELRAETFTHADDCPHSKKSPTASPVRDS